MKFLEKYKPKPNEVIYHYCNSDAFNSICQFRTVRLSDLFSMNDGLEIKWGYSIWIEVANILIKDLGHDFIDKIDKEVHLFGLRSLIISASFSMKSDVLSQWRAYADDGKGYCIGFKAKDIFSLPVYPIKILYNKKEQIKKVTETVKFIHFSEQNNTDKFGKDFKELCFFFATELASMKNPSFDEEKEIRIIHLLSFSQSNDGLRLKDDGGFAFGKEVDGQKINFRFRDDCPIAYQDYDFTNGQTINPIKQVVIGPKNKSLPTGVSIFLETIGIDKVDVINSRVPYV